MYTRQIERRINRAVADETIRTLLKGLPRRLRRELQRTYANAAYRWNHPEVCHPNRHATLRVQPNPSIVGYVAGAAEKVMYGEVVNNE